MPDIYAQHAKHFGDVSAYVIHDKTRAVARVSLKFPRDGAGRLYAYVHWLGSPMTRGFASGGGYAKDDAAIAVAARLVERDPNQPDMARFLDAIARDDGHDWQTRAREAGFCVYRAV